MGKIIPARLIVASLLCLNLDELINFRELANGGAVTLNPAGQKYKFTAEQLAAKEKSLVAREIDQLETRGRLPAADLVPNPMLDKMMETKKRLAIAEPGTKEVETETPAAAADPASILKTANLRSAEDPAPNILDKIMETKGRRSIAKPVTKKKPSK
jgi:hypothetical protein